MATFSSPIALGEEQAPVRRATAAQRERLNKTATRAVALVVFFTAWEALGRQVNPVLFTYPTAILSAAGEMIASGELWQYAAPSLKVFAYGFGASIAIGIPLAVLMARVPVVDWALDMFVAALYSTPIVALVPLLVLWFGFDALAKSVVIFLMAVFPVLINTHEGVRSVDPKLLEVARSFGSTERMLWGDVIIPSAVPFIVAGLRLGVGRALVGMVIADFYTAVGGLGYLIVQAANGFQTDRLFVPVILLMILGVTLMGILGWLQGRVAPWTRQEIAL